MSRHSLSHRSLPIQESCRPGNDAMIAHERQMTTLAENATPAGAAERPPLGGCCAVYSGDQFHSPRGLAPAVAQLVRYRRAIGLSGFRRVYPGGGTTGPLPQSNWPFRLPSGLSRRWHNWSATAEQLAFPASVGFIPAVAQLVRYRRAIALSGFRRVYPGGGTTGPLPQSNRPFRLPSGLSRRCHNWSATDRHGTPSVESPTCHHTGTSSRPSQAAACFGLGGAPFCL